MKTSRRDSNRFSFGMRVLFAMKMNLSKIRGGRRVGKTKLRHYATIVNVTVTIILTCSSKNRGRVYFAGFRQMR